MPDEVEILTSIPQPPNIELIGGQTKIFPFRIPPSGAYELIIEHNMPRQDFSLKAWLSFKPIDNLIENTWNQRQFTIPKIQSRVWLGSIDPDPKLEKYYLSVYKLQQDVTYYLNVKNLENHLNGFELAFVIPGSNIIVPAPAEVVITEEDLPTEPSETIVIGD